MLFNGLIIITAILIALPAAGARTLAEVTASDRHETPSVRILEPEDQSILPAGKPVLLRYEAAPGLKGKYLHLQVDDDDPAVLESLHGRNTVGPLEPGKHRIRLWLVNRAHVELGIEDTITIEVKGE